MRYSGKTLMSLGSMVIAAWVVITALKWPLRTAIFPIIIGFPVFFMAMAELLLSLSERQRDTKKGSVEGLNPPEMEEHALPIGQTLVAFILLISLLLFIFFFGFPIGVPLFVFLFLKVYGRERWGISIGLAAAAWASLYLLFVRLLDTPFPEGWVQRGLRVLGIG